MAGDANVLVQVQRRFWNQIPEPKTPGRPADHPPRLGSRDSRHQAHDQTLGQVRSEQSRSSSGSWFHQTIVTAVAPSPCLLASDFLKSVTQGSVSHSYSLAKSFVLVESARQELKMGKPGKVGRNQGQEA